MSSHVIRQFFTLRNVLQSPARRGSFFFFFFFPPPFPSTLPVRNVTGSIKPAEHYLSLTLCLSRKREREEKKAIQTRTRHLRPREASTLSVQQLVSASVQPKETICSGADRFLCPVFFSFFLGCRMLRVNHLSLPAKHLPLQHRLLIRSTPEEQILQFCTSCVGQRR